MVDLAKLGISETLLKNCKQWLSDTGKDWKTGVAKGTTARLDQYVVERLPGVMAPHTACHSWLNYAFQSIQNGYDQSSAYKAGAKPFLVLNCSSDTRSKNVCSPEARQFLCRWVARESPFREFILNTDDDCQDGVILLCGPGGLDNSQALWICKLLRFAVEAGKAAETFMTLVKGGVDGMLAIAVATFIRGYEGGKFTFTDAYAHQQIVYDEDTDIRAMIERSFVEKADRTQSIFRSKDRKSSVMANKTKFQNFCKPVQKPDGWGGFIRGEGASPEELVAEVLKYQEELGYKPGDVGRFVAPPPPIPPAPTASTVFLDFDM